MARGFNSVILVGCLTKKAELKYTPSGLAILDLNVAGNDRIIGDDSQVRDIAWYHRVSVLGKQAEYLADQLEQGTMVFIDGRVNYRAWEQEGQKRSAVDVKGIRVEVLTPGIRKENPTVADSLGQPRLTNALNQVTVVGNLTRDAEMRYTPNGNAVTRIGIAVNEQYRDRSGQDQENVHFIDIQVWRELAEGLADLGKGDGVMVMGRLVNDSWQDQEGNKRYRTYVEGTRIETLTRGPSSGGAATRSQPAQSSAQSSGASAPAAAMNTGIDTVQVDAQASQVSKLDIDEEFPPEEDLPF